MTACEINTGWAGLPVHRMRASPTLAELGILLSTARGRDERRKPAPQHHRDKDDDVDVLPPRGREASLLVTVSLFGPAAAGCSSRLLLWSDRLNGAPSIPSLEHPP